MDKPRHPQVTQPWKTRLLQSNKAGAPPVAARGVARTAAHNLPRTMPRSSKRG